MTVIPSGSRLPKFSGSPPRNPGEYARELYPGNSGQASKTRLFVSPQAPNKPFIAWPGQTGVVHALTILKTATGPAIRFLTQRRDAMGGTVTLEAPAGKYADKDPGETAIQGAEREVQEETGLIPVKTMLLSDEPFATSPGITNERKDFAVVLTDGQGPQALTENEKRTMLEPVDIPLDTFLDTERFAQWRRDMGAKGYLLGIDIPTIRGLMPDRQTLLDFIG